MSEHTTVVLLMRAAARSVSTARFIRSSSRHTKEQIKTMIRQTYELAITCNVRFEPDDVADVYREFGGRYGSSFYFSPADERWYALACQHNQSTAASMERLMKRPVFNAPPGTLILTWDEQELPARRRRLYEGAKFMWRGKVLKVTSFGPQDATAAPKDKYLIACSYDVYGDLERRIKFTPESLKVGKTAKELEEAP